MGELRYGEKVIAVYKSKVIDEMVAFQLREWFSGKIQRCHRWAPSSILGSRIEFVDIHIQRIQIFPFAPILKKLSNWCHRN